MNYSNGKNGSWTIVDFLKYFCSFLTWFLNHFLWFFWNFYEFLKFKKILTSRKFFSPSQQPTNIECYSSLPKLVTNRSNASKTTNFTHPKPDFDQYYPYTHHINFKTYGCLSRSCDTPPTIAGNEYEYDRKTDILHRGWRKIE